VKDYFFSIFAPQFSKHRLLNYLKNFVIPFRGLNLGVHNYNWEVDKTFFEAIENPEIEDCKLNINLEFEKQDRMMVLGFNITGTIETLCDRCLENLTLPIDSNETLYIKFGSERKEESEDVLIIPESEYQVDISKLINEYVTLSIPMKKVHQEDETGKSGCNEETIKKLQEVSKNKSIDPRWEKLKNLKIE